MSETPSTLTYQAFVGIDLGAQEAVAVWQRVGQPVSAPLTFDPQDASLSALRPPLEALGVPGAACLVVLEATGSYWITLATALAQAGYAVSVINPQQAHHFAKALLQRTKTDVVDAHTLLRLATTLQPDPWQPPPAVYTELAQRLAQRDDLIQMRQQLRNQRHALLQHPVVVAEVLARTDQLLSLLEAQIAAIEAELVPVLQQDAAWAAAARRLQTIPGIGLLTAVSLLVATLAFSACASPEAATAYAGLAPHRRDSGSSVRGHLRVGRSGHKGLRTSLYLATLSAARFNPIIRPFYERLRAAGKPPKVARCAAARKLLHVAWAVVTKECDFDPARAPAPLLTTLGA